VYHEQDGNFLQQSSIANAALILKSLEKLHLECRVSLAWIFDSPQMSVFEN